MAKGRIRQVASRTGWQLVTFYGKSVGLETPRRGANSNARQKLQRVFGFHFRNGNLSTELAVAPGRSNLGLRLNYEVLRQPVCSLFYLQSITIIPIIITTAIPAAHMTQTAARSGMCKNFATIVVNRLTVRRDSR